MKKYLILVLLFWNVGLYAQETNLQTLERLMEKNKYYEVLKCINSLYPKTGKPSEILIYEGKANEGVLHYKEAYRCYSDWVKIDSTNREAQLALARVAALSGRTMKAIDIYEKLVQEDTLDFFVNYQLGRLYQQNGKLTSAIQVYERLFQADTTNSTLLKRTGECYAQMSWNRLAVGSYEKAFRLDPEDGKVVVKAVNLMMTYPVLFSNYVYDGMKLVDSALVYSPRLNSLKQLRGILLYLQNRYPECENTFRELLVHGDSSRVNFRYLGLALFHMNRFKEALEPLAYADSLSQDSRGERTDFDLSMRYGENLRHCKETQKALQVFHEIEQQMMPDTVTLFHLAVLNGDVYKQLNDHRQTVRSYWKAYRLNPLSKNIIHNLVSLHYELWTEDGKRQKASIKEVQQALFFHILFLQKIVDSHPDNKHSYHSVSKHILQKELENTFFKNENKIIVLDPNGRKHSYSTDEIRELIHPKTY